MIFHRHDIVFSKIDESLISPISNEDFKTLIINKKIPGIVRREEIEPNNGENYYTVSEKVYVGFVYPYTIDGQRLRFGAAVEGRDIYKLITPYEIPYFDFNSRSSSLKALLEIRNEYKVGVWGSSSLEIVTGLNYTHEKSDLDLIVKNYSLKELYELFEFCIEKENKYNIKIDIEIFLKNGYGVNLKEIHSSSSSLLAKGLRNVILIDRTKVEALL